MPSAADRLEFGPPRDSGSVRAFGLALLAHLLLMGALTWGINWKRTDKAASFEAEIWSSVPEAAAPKLIEAPSTPPPPPARPAPVVTAPPAPKVDIALEQEKKRKLLQQQKEEAENQRQAKLKAELQAKKEKELKDQKAKEELAKRKAAEDAKKAEAKKQDAKEDEKQKQAEAAAKKQRDDNIRRMMGQAGATGGATATGTATASKGPSASYGGKVRAKVVPNIVFTDDITGNPTAEVEVRTTLDGTVLSQRLVKSSGNKAWDDAVIKAIIRTGTMPRDVDGRVPTPMILEFRPKD
ncbi:colicin import membrane protein [Polaromonas sp. YR568]|uniref:cell envelope integrity protein TolA n=1 Tax=Polaromonas sp. YR568 TaxID=1855301 RepID=UPI0008DEBEE1|nr:cell envelope integrity protein TolA [Polaromonas sp. YR568]SFU94389.1 colicin import membrane protein [Polaromonas sp. YR568]